jgi:hypothetical protein
MKKLLIILSLAFICLNSVVVLFSAEVFKFASDMKTTLMQPTHFHGHEVSGMVPTWVAILCMIAPLLIVSITIGIAYIKFTINQKVQERKLFA